jgi:hypothetical protein
VPTLTCDMNLGPFNCDFGTKCVRGASARPIQLFEPVRAEVGLREPLHLQMVLGRPGVAQDRSGGLAPW